MGGVRAPSDHETAFGIRIGTLRRGSRSTVLIMFEPVGRSSDRRISRGRVGAAARTTMTDGNQRPAAYSFSESSGRISKMTLRSTAAARSRRLTRLGQVEQHGLSTLVDFDEPLLQVFGCYLIGHGGSPPPGRKWPASFRYRNGGEVVQGAGPEPAFILTLDNEGPEALGGGGGGNCRKWTGAQVGAPSSRRN